MPAESIPLNCEGHHAKNGAETAADLAVLVARARRRHLLFLRHPAGRGLLLSPHALASSDADAL